MSNGVSAQNKPPPMDIGGGRVSDDLFQEAVEDMLLRFLLCQT